MYGVVLTIQGYNDKVHLLLDKLLAALTTFQPDADRFNVHKERYVRDLQNFKVRSQ